MEKCVICRGNHFIYRCQQFIRFNSNTKQDIVRQHKLCNNWLSNTHKLNECLSHRTCSLCNKKHHTLLHIQQAPRNLNTCNSYSNKNTNNNRSFSTQSAHSSDPAIENVNDGEFTNSFSQPSSVSMLLQSNQWRTKHLPTAIVKIVNENGKIATLRALIDPGSDDNYIIHRHAKLLNLKMIRSQQNISVLGDNSGGPAPIGQYFCYSLK